MNETKTSSAEVGASGGAVEPAEAPQAQDAPGVSPIDLENRPEGSWLDDVEREIDDVDLVLKCLARDNATMCQACSDLQSTGDLEARPTLARCASTKQPR